MTPRKALPIINTSRCTGCGRCVAACPPNVLWLTTDTPNGMGRKHAQLHDTPGCTGCAQCAVTCPFGVIDMVRIPNEMAHSRDGDGKLL